MSERQRRDRGNVSVMFFFGAMLIFAMIMAVAATGQKLIQRETLQDSADAAALAGAVVRAKALNFIAFCNLVDAALAAVFVILKGVAFGLQIFLPIASSLCSSHHYDYCAYIPYAQQVQQRYQMAGERMQQMMSTLARGERTVAQIAPAMALAEAYKAGTDDAFQRNYGSGLSVQTVPGGPESLPVTDGDASEWWQKAQDPYGR
ncbi:MAG TPA: pilus assembly protein TadG-related protein, partial [Polyangia bacterium]